jgi:hypothetical protein
MSSGRMRVDGPFHRLSDTDCPNRGAAGCCEVVQYVTVSSPPAHAVAAASQVTCCSAGAIGAVRPGLRRSGERAADHPGVSNVRPGVVFVVVAEY